MTLATRVRLGRDVDHDLRAVARNLAARHSYANRSAVIADGATQRSLHRTWSDLVARLEPFTPDVLPGDELRLMGRMAERYLAGRDRLLTSRIAAGRICAGNDGLSIETIVCMPDGPEILTASAGEVVSGDVLLHVAKLAMELEFLGRVDLAQEFLAYYVVFAGEHAPASLVHHYSALHALEAALDSCRIVEHREGVAAADARRLARIAFAHLERARPTLALIGGPPGSGKSTLAAAVAEAQGWVLVRTDEVRHDVAQIARDSVVPSLYDTGIYTAQMTAQTYAAVVARAEAMLAMGESVVVDATWAVGEWRLMAAKVATDTHSELVQMICSAPDDVCEVRLRGRGANPALVNAGVAVAHQIAAHFDAWSGAVHVDTSKDVALALATALEVIGTAGADRRGRWGQA